jgi:hypothetical protein
LVGENIGTAPDARVYFVAAPSWLEDAQYYADALDWIIQENEKLPEKSKIRVVSVSTMPSGQWALLHKNHDAWDAAYKRAMDAGILVLDCTYEHGYTVPCTYDLHDPNNVAACSPDNYSPSNRVNVPASRTTATEGFDRVMFSYQFSGNGGMSWTVPYLAGILAMGWQVNPEANSSQLLDMLFVSSYVTDSEAKIINPKAFIEMVRDTTKK